MLFDAPGLGKTITAIHAARELGVTSILAVVPTVVLWNWEHEFRKWGAPGWRVQVVDHGTQPIDSGANVVITTHGLMLRAGLFFQLVRRRWDLCILDEAQFFRSPRAKRTRAFYELDRERNEPTIVAACDRTWILSGTPAPNGYACELWTHIRGLFPDMFIDVKGASASYGAFRHAFCRVRETRWGTKVVANRNVGRLKAKLVGVMLRRTDKSNLPSIRYELVTLKPKMLPWELRELEGMLNPKLIAKIKAEASDDMTPELGWTSLKDKQAWSRLRRLVGLAKVEPVVELLQMELGCGALDKVVVGAHHKAVVHGLCKGLSKFGAVEITGDTQAWRRAQLVQAFQERPNVRVIVCNILAGGVGVTLTAAADVVLAEASQVPGENLQLADRVHRIGQDKKVRVRFFALAGTIDEDLTEGLRRKTAMVREVVES